MNSISLVVALPPFSYARDFLYGCVVARGINDFALEPLAADFPAVRA